jgi:hypothetical protein
MGPVRVQHGRAKHAVDAGEEFQGVPGPERFIHQRREARIREGIEIEWWVPQFGDPCAQRVAVFSV